MDGSTIHGANLTTIVYGADVPSSQDCSEVWFEASKIYNDGLGLSWSSSVAELARVEGNFLTWSQEFR